VNGEEETHRRHVKIFIRLASSFGRRGERNWIEQNVFYAATEKNNLLAIAGTISICWGLGVSLLCANHPQVKQTRIIHGHSRLYRERYRSLSIRFRAISHGTSRKRWRGGLRELPLHRKLLDSWHFFFHDAHPSIPSHDKRRWLEKRDRCRGRKDSIAYNHREVWWILSMID